MSNVLIVKHCELYGFSAIQNNDNYHYDLLQYYTIKFFLQSTVPSCCSPRSRRFGASTCRTPTTTSSPRSPYPTSTTPSPLTTTLPTSASIGRMTARYTRPTASTASTWTGRTSTRSSMLVCCHQRIIVG